MKNKINGEKSFEPPASGFWPQYLLLELSSRCNLRCIMCAINQDPRMQKGGEWFGDLDPAVFKNIEPYLSKIVRVDLNGNGESLMNRDFLPILEKVKLGGAFAGLTSNALMINDDVARGIVNAGLDEIVISFHAAEPALFEEISRPAKFETFLDNVKAINKYKEYYRTGLPVIKFNFVAMKKNISQLEKVIEFAAELRAVEVAVLVLVEYDLVRGESLVNYPELVKEYFPPAIECAQKSGVNLNLPPLYINMLPKQAEAELKEQKTAAPGRRSWWRLLRYAAKALLTPNPNEPGNLEVVRDCLDPWTFCWVMQSGRVRPCCFMEKDMGSLSDRSLEEIWFGEKYRSFRRQILKNNPPRECTECVQRPLTTMAHLKRRVRAATAWSRLRSLTKPRGAGSR